MNEYVKPVKEEPNYRRDALIAASKLPNKSINELLANADKIEYWLREPEILAQKMMHDLYAAMEDKMVNMRNK